MSLKANHNTFDTVFEKFVESFEFLWRGTTVLSNTQTFTELKDFKDLRLRLVCEIPFPLSQLLLSRESCRVSLSISSEVFVVFI